MQESVREGVRAAVTCTPSTGLNSAIQQVVTQYSFGFVNSSNVSNVLQITYLTPSLGTVSGQVTTGDVVKVSVKNVKVSSVPALLIPTQGSAASWSSPLYVGAVSADMMACATPATP